MHEILLGHAFVQMQIDLLIHIIQLFVVQRATLNIVTAMKSWPETMPSLMERTTDDKCYQQVATVALC